MKWSEEELAEYQRKRAGHETSTESAVKQVFSRSKTTNSLGLKRDGSLNTLESRFRDQLEEWKMAGLVRWYIAKPCAFRISQGCHWYPDFMVWWGYAKGPFSTDYRPTHWEIDQSFAGVEQNIQLIDVKGFWRDDALVKVKTIAELYPCFLVSSVMWDKKGKTWRWRHF